MKTEYSTGAANGANQSSDPPAYVQTETTLPSDPPAYVQTETANWMNRIVPEENDKYVMMAAAIFVNCIAFVPIDALTSAPCRRQTG